MDKKGNSVKEITFTVHCINGEKIMHRYKVPSTIKEVEKLLDNIIDMTTAAIAGNKRIMYLQNPNIEYNPHNIVAVEFGGITSGQIDQLIKETEKRMGFVKK